MLNFKRLAFFMCLALSYQTAFCQLGFSQEIGVIAGPVQFRSDYGVRDNSPTNFGNSGIGIGIVHYLNFSYKADCSCYTTDTYFNDHFKLRNEISWNKTKLEHFGEFVDPSKTSEDANKLRAHKGYAKNLDIGTQIEFYPLSIRSFEGFGYRFAPFISLGVHYTLYNPEVTTTYANPDPTAIGDVTDASNFYSGWNPGSVRTSGGDTFSLVSSVGVRYKLNRMSDLMLDLRGQYFLLNDSIDGLDHQLPSNKNKDWLMWLNVGYIYYLN